LIVSVVSQKGGVGKSSISRTLAVEFTRSGWKTLLADIDLSQITSNRWAEKRRQVSGIQPIITTDVYPTASMAIKVSNEYDLVIIDGAPHSTQGTLDAAKASSLVIIPTGSSMDDLEPGIMLADELAKSLNSDNIVFALYKTTSHAQERESAETLSQYGYEVLFGSIQSRTGYIEAFDKGYCATETKYSKMNERASQLVQSVAHRLSLAD